MMQARAPWGIVVGAPRGRECPFRERFGTTTVLVYGFIHIAIVE